MEAPKYVLESFENELKILKAFADLRYSIFNPIGTFFLKQRFKMMPSKLGRIAAELFCVDIRCGLAFPGSKGKVAMPYIGTLARVTDPDTEKCTVEYIPRKNFKPHVNENLEIDGMKILEESAANFLRVTMQNDRKLKNLSIPDLFNAMCFKISQELYFGHKINLPSVGTLNPDLTFKPDAVLVDSIKALNFRSLSR